MDYSKFDDPTLIRLAANGKQDALSELYDRHGRLVYSLALNALGDARLAEDLTQEVFIRSAFGNLFFWQQWNRSQSAVPDSLLSVRLEGTGPAPGATGVLVISRGGEYGTLIVDGLPALNASQQYQLWLILDGQRTSGGVFAVNPEGYGSLKVLSPKPLNAYQAVGVTIEPAGGSPRPTGEKVLGGNL